MQMVVVAAVIAPCEAQQHSNNSKQTGEASVFFFSTGHEQLLYMTTTIGQPNDLMSIYANHLTNASCSLQPVGIRSHFFGGARPTTRKSFNFWCSACFFRHILFAFAVRGVRGPLGLYVCVPVWGQQFA